MFGYVGTKLRIESLGSKLDPFSANFTDDMYNYMGTMNRQGLAPPSAMSLILNLPKPTSGRIGHIGLVVSFR